MAWIQNVLDDPRTRLYPMRWQGKIYGVLRPKTLPSKAIQHAVKPTAKEKDGSVYRLYNASNKDHLYTIDHSEALACQKEGWKFKGVAWIALNKGNPVLRLVNPFNEVHPFTIDEKRLYSNLDEKNAFRGMKIR